MTCLNNDTQSTFNETITEKEQDANIKKSEDKIREHRIYSWCYFIDEFEPVCLNIMLYSMLCFSVVWPRLYDN